MDETFKVATANLHSSPDRYYERVTAAGKEANENQVQVLLVQELSTEHKTEVVKIMTEAGYPHSFIAEPVTKKHTPHVGSSTAIFSNIPLSSNLELTLTKLPGAQPAAIAVLNHNGYDIHLISAHLAWGAENGPVRLKQAVIIADYAHRIQDRNKDALVFVGGTFNDIPDGDSVRYLKGLKTADDLPTTYWVDGTADTSIENTPTTRHDTEWGIASAQRTGVLRPEFLPERKTDYLFVNGWVYGSAGTPLNAELFATTKTLEGHDISDHYGVQTDFWLPKKIS